MAQFIDYWLLAKKTGWTPDQIDAMDAQMVESFLTIARMEDVSSEEDVVNFIKTM